MTVVPFVEPGLPPLPQNSIEIGKRQLIVARWNDGRSKVCFSYVDACNRWRRAVHASEL
jgi:hypothetical protein